MTAAAQHLPPRPKPVPNAPGMFAFADRDHVTERGARERGSVAGGGAGAAEGHWNQLLGGELFLIVNSHDGPAISVVARAWGMIFRNRFPRLPMCVAPQRRRTVIHSASATTLPQTRCG
jgi:hypothetical protein